MLALLAFSGALLPLLLYQSVENTALTDPSEGAPLIQAIYIGIYTITLFLILGRWEQFIYVSTRDKLLLLLVAVALISVLWSAAPELTLRRSLALVGTTFFGVYLAMRYTLPDLLRLLAWALGIAALLSLVFNLALPSYGTHVDILRGDAWRGIYLHKNILGRLMAISAVVFLLLAMRSRRGRWLTGSGFGLSVGPVLLSRSVTALIVLLTVLALLPMYRALRWRHTRIVPFFIVASILLGGTALWLWGSADSLLNAVGRDVTLTGRTGLWAVVLERIWERPWLGYGYNGFWLGSEGESANIMFGLRTNPYSIPMQLPHAHNGFLDLGLDLGLLGVAILALCLVANFARGVALVRSSRNPEGLWPLVYLTFFVLYNLTESTILTRNNIFWVLFVTIVLSLGAWRSSVRVSRGSSEGASLAKPARHLAKLGRRG